MAAPVVKSSQYDSLQGCSIERGTFTATPGSVTNAAQVTVNPDTSSPTCKSGDQIFVTARTITTGLVLVAASVTGTNTVALVIYNPTASPVVGAQTTYDYTLLRYS